MKTFQKLTQLQAVCQNCKWTGQLNAFGIQEHQMLETHCPECGNKTLKEQNQELPCLTD